MDGTLALPASLDGMSLTVARVGNKESDVEKVADRGLRLLFQSTSGQSWSEGGTIG
jgi:hypothetical protein